MVSKRINHQIYQLFYRLLLRDLNLDLIQNNQIIIIEQYCYV